MRITPQKVIEALDNKRIAAMGYFRSPAAVASLVPALSQAVLFTFPDISCSEHAAFACDLYERGLFTLPFPVTAVAFERDLGAPYGKRGGMMLLSQVDKTAKLTAVTISEVLDDDGDLALPIGFADGIHFEKDGETGAKCYDGTVPLVSDAVLKAMYGGHVDAHEVFRGRMMNNVLMSMGLITTLMSKGVSAQLIAASEKLNRARAKRGKPAIPDRYVVSIDPNHLRTVHTEGGGLEDITGHTRGAPRMHWRRGHFRVLNRGEEAERVVPVAPSLVGANERAADIRAKAYAVRG